MIVHFGETMKMKLVGAFCLLFALCPYAEGGQQDKKRVQDYLKDVSEVEHCEIASDGLRRCKDGSVSFRQEGNPAYGDNNCGPTAVANASANLCGMAVTPSEVAAFVRSSSTNALDLQQALRDYVGKVRGCKSLAWDRIRPRGIRWQDQDRTLAWLVTPYTGQLRDWVPAIVSLRTHPDRAGHWTTVVAVEADSQGCRVRHNTWGQQWRTPCERFSWLMNNGQGTLYLARWRG